MCYKKIDCDLGFADLALANSLKHNRSFKFMDKLKNTIDWTRVNEILMGHYTVGTSGEGAGAWPPLLLFKGGLNSQADRSATRKSLNSE